MSGQARGKPVPPVRVLVPHNGRFELAKRASVVLFVVLVARAGEGREAEAERRPIDDLISDSRVIPICEHP